MGLDYKGLWKFSFSDLKTVELLNPQNLTKPWKPLKLKGDKSTKRLLKHDTEIIEKTSEALSFWIAVDYSSKPDRNKPFGLSKIV